MVLSVPMVLLLVSLALSPLYLWSSGLPQVSHLVGALAIAWRLLLKPKFYCGKWWRLGAVFVCYAFIVGLIVFAIYGDIHTLLSPVYYAFGFAVFLLIVTFAREKQTFLLWVFGIHFVALFLLTVFSVFGVGRAFGMGRFMFTFNDPNQMANWVLWAAIIVGSTGRAIFGNWVPGLFALFLAATDIVFSASRSGALGLGVLVLIYGFMAVSWFVRILQGRASLKVRKWMVLVFCVLTALVVVGCVRMEQEESNVLLAQAKFLLNRFWERDPDDTLEGRGYDRIWKFPEYLFLGAGEGAHERYASRTWFLGEIHSSWAGLLFNYGIVGFCFFFAFLYFLLRGMRFFWFKAMFLSPFVYGFAIYNIRNWYFWVGIAVLYASGQVVAREGLSGRRVTGTNGKDSQAREDLG
jgi:hypothetical protein